MTHHRFDYPTLLHQRGFRMTPQRQMILDAICEGGGHTTPDEIYARVRARAPHLNRATVYRSLDFLCELRLVVAAHISGQMVYEIAGEEPHHHLVCHTCGRTEDLPHRALRGLFRRLDREHGFLVDMDHVALSGLCGHCRPEQPARRGA